MNKKLFSWKALAGLALLVAMGLTSCQQGTEVDPTDPYKPKPVTPGSSTKGSADVTITVLAGSDLVAEYNKWVGTLTADQKKAIADAKVFTLGINAANYKLDGTTLTLPAVWAASAEKTLNVEFTGGVAEAKKPLIIDADANNPGANVNITLPTGEYDLALTAGLVRPTITSAGATVKTLTGTTPSAAKNILAIGEGVAIKVIDIANDVKLAGGSIEAAKLTSVSVTGEDDGTIKKNGQKFKNLVIDTYVSVAGKAADKKLKLENVHILGNGILWIAGNVESIDNISGDLDSNKKLQAEVWADAFVGKLSKVILSTASTPQIEIKDGSILDNVQINDPVKMSANIGSVTGVVFAKNVTVDFDKNDLAFAFKGVKFNSGVNVIVSGSVESEEIVTYATATYSVATGLWTEGADDASVAINDKVVKVGTDGKLYDKDGKEVIPAEDKIRFKKSSKKLTTVPANCSITLDAATVTASGVNGSTVTTLFGGAQPTDPGYSVILGDAKYTWKLVATTPAASYELRK